jgi:CheY-like chemotaxis protein
VTEDSCRGGHTIVVGDSENGFGPLQHVLDGLGLPCVTATLSEVLCLPEIAPPRLIVLDSNAERDERCRQQDRLRRMAGGHGAPMIVLGDDAAIPCLSLAVAHGASAYFKKPVNDVDLLAVARKLLSFDGDAPLDERRLDPRRPFFVPVELERAQNRGRNRAVVVDASRTGCRIETSAAIGTGEMVRVWLPATEATANLPLTGETCWAGDSSGGRRLAGIQFTANASILASLALGLLDPSDS